jgi:hypothetical protein
MEIILHHIKSHFNAPEKWIRRKRALPYYP